MVKAPHGVFITWAVFDAWREREGNFLVEAPRGVFVIWAVFDTWWKREENFKIFTSYCLIWKERTEKIIV